MIANSTREEIAPRIFHYTFDLAIGDGPYDVIRLHRVVRERRPHSPDKTKKNVFFLHGDAQPFESVLLYGKIAPSVADDQSAAIYFAEAGIDVWGMDQPWMLVPLETTDFGFMSDWGFQYSVDNLDVGVKVARAVRALTGGRANNNKINLMAWSSGVPTAYALLAAEAGLPHQYRQIGGFIPVDGGINYDEADRAGQCGYAEFYTYLFDSGIYEDTFGLDFFITLGTLALDDPDSPSPFPDFEGFTNFQAAIGFAAYPDPLLDPYHLLAGVFDDDFFPTGFQYTATDGFLEWQVNAEPYGATKFVSEYFSLGCGSPELPFDDDLGNITVPIFYVGAGGGDGLAGLYSTTLVGSTDVTSTIVSFENEENRFFDYGHADLWLSESAESLAWDPIAAWIDDHTRPGGGRVRSTAPVIPQRIR
jgi:hypothetical protein